MDSSACLQCCSDIFPQAFLIFYSLLFLPARNPYRYAVVHGAGLIIIFFILCTAQLVLGGLPYVSDGLTHIQLLYFCLVLMTRVRNLQDSQNEI